MAGQRKPSGRGLLPYSPLVQGWKGNVLPAMETFRDAFTDTVIDPDVWFSTNDSGCTTTQSGGQLLLTIPAATVGPYAKLTSFATYSLIGSYAYVQLTIPTGAFTTFGVEAHFRLQSPNGAYLLRWMWTSDGFIQADYAIGGTASQVAAPIAYSATSHKWLRIREAAGTVFWDTAPDSGSGTPGTWTQQFSKTIASLTWNPEQLAASFWCGEWQSPGASVTGAAKFDGFNVNATPTTFTATGVLLADGALVTGDANLIHTATHDSSGAPTADGAGVTGAASRFRAFGSTGALTANGSLVTGASNRFRAFGSTGVLLANGALVTGAGNRFRTFGSTGALRANGALVTGASNRFRTFGSTGALLANGALVTGASNRFRTFGSTGALTANGALVTGASNRFRAFGSTGALVAAGALVSGASRRFRAFGSTGALLANGALVTGTGNRFRAFGTSGQLTAGGAYTAGTAVRFRAFNASGVLVADGTLVTASAARTGSSAVSADFSGAYLVYQAITQDLVASYTVIAAVSADFAEAYQVFAPLVPVHQDYIGSYAVIRNVWADLGENYVVVDQFGNFPARSRKWQINLGSPL